MSQMIFRILIIFAILLAGCTSQKQSLPLPVEFDREDACRICGMITVDVPGPKAQIHYRDGNIDKFCCTLHMFSFYLQPDRPSNIAVIYVTDIGKADREQPADHWIDAKKALYVYGGSLKGSHGEALVPFSLLEDAEVYVSRYGGKIVRFDDVTIEMLKPSIPAGTGDEHMHGHTMSEYRGK